MDEATSVAARPLEGRTIVVTGLGQGLGRAFALAIAKAGGAVAGMDIDAGALGETEKLLKEQGARCLLRVGSVTDERETETLLDDAESSLGPIRGLVNNAGLNHEADPFHETPEAIRRVIDVNVVGALIAGTLTCRRMTAGDSIINVVSGALLGLALQPTYSASKGAMASATLSWALALAPHGIRVNAVAPVAYTRMVRTPAARALIPADRDPDLVAPLVVWMLSDRSRAVTGQVVRFDGMRMQVLGHPHLSTRPVDRRVWQLDDIDAAFRGPLATEMQQYGLIELSAISPPVHPREPYDGDH